MDCECRAFVMESGLVVRVDETLALAPAVDDEVQEAMCPDVNGVVVAMRMQLNLQRNENE